MAGEWTSAQLKDIAAQSDRAFAMGPFGSNIRAENYRESGVPVIRGTNLGEAGEAPFMPYDFVFLSEEKADELSSSSAVPKDIVFVAQGTVGKVGIVPTNTPYRRFVLSQNLMKVTVNPERADPRFVFYFFRSPAGQHEIMSRVNPTGVPCISKPLTSLRQFGIRLPDDVAEQRAIARILGSLDDKIELNRRMNETLEATAQALFKSWFVDAVKDGLPDGWRVSKVGAELVTLLGGTPSRSEPLYWQGGIIPWINSGKANEFRVVEPSEYITQAGMENSATKMLPARTTIVAITGATLGQVSLLEIAACANQSIVGVLGSEQLPSEYVYFWFKANIDDLVSRQTGGAQQHVNKNNVNDLDLLCPLSTVMRGFVRLVRPLFDRIRDNCLESSDLAAVRDALLPRLMSGEISPVPG